MKKQLDLLSAGKGDSIQQAEALIFVIHFVGDLHQPLHACDNNDRGGNCLPVTFFGKSPELRDPSSETYSPNLHSVWDTALVERIAAGQPVTRLAARLARQFSLPITKWKREPVNLEAWAWESHDLAVSTSYGRLNHRVRPEPPQPVQQCSDGHVGNRLKLLHEEIDAEYFAAAAPVIEEQLTKAGTRLALLLNQLWP